MSGSRARRTRGGEPAEPEEEQPPAWAAAIARPSMEGLRARDIAPPDGSVFMLLAGSRAAGGAGFMQTKLAQLFAAVGRPAPFMSKAEGTEIHRRLTGKARNASQDVQAREIEALLQNVVPQIDRDTEGGVLSENVTRMLDVAMRAAAERRTAADVARAVGRTEYVEQPEFYVQHVTLLMYLQVLKVFKPLPAGGPSRPKSEQASDVFLEQARRAADQYAGVTPMEVGDPPGAVTPCTPPRAPPVPKGNTPQGHLNLSEQPDLHSLFPNSVMQSRLTVEEFVASFEGQSKEEVSAMQGSALLQSMRDLYVPRLRDHEVREQVRAEFSTAKKRALAEAQRAPASQEGARGAAGREGPRMRGRRRDRGESSPREPIPGHLVVGEPVGESGHTAAWIPTPDERNPRDVVRSRRRAECFDRHAREASLRTPSLGRPDGARSVPEQRRRGGDPRDPAG